MITYFSQNTPVNKELLTGLTPFNKELLTRFTLVNKDLLARVLRSITSSIFLVFFCFLGVPLHHHVTRGYSCRGFVNVSVLDNCTTKYFSWGYYLIIRVSGTGGTCF